MASTEEEVNPYELLGVTLDVADGDIRKAYRQRSLKVHPDRVCVVLYVRNIHLTNLLFKESQ